MSVVATHARPQLDVVIVCYRSAGYVRGALDSAREALRDIEGAGVIVVDNGSGDDLASVVEQHAGPVRLLLRHVNDGFARGCHAGVELSRAERVLFLNPDAELLPDTVHALQVEADRFPRAGIVGGRCVRHDGTTDARSWFGRPTLWSAFCFASGLSSIFPGSPRFDPESADRWDGDAREVDVVSGGMMLVERALWDEVGGFDRDFLLYGEDADFCLRAGVAGWVPRVCPEARFRHSVGASSTSTRRLSLVLQGQVTTYRKQFPGLVGGLAAHLLVLGTGLRAMGAGLRRPGCRPHASHASWQEAWRRREEWRRGWRPGDRLSA